MRIALMALLAIGAFGAAMASAADASIETYSFDIPAQKLNDALQALAFASQHKLLYSSKLVDGRDSQALKGDYTAEEAVERLLAGTGLVYQVTADGLVVIREGNTSAVPVSSTAGEREKGVRLTRMDGQSASQSQGANEAQGSSPSAQSAEGLKLEEIVVTAQKRKELLKDVPISITVLTGDRLDQSFARSMQEELSRLPGVATLGDGLVGDTRITVRGVTPVGPTSSVAAFYLDSVPFNLVGGSQIPDANVYDLDHIEALRGPQGTLYGANALNGVIRVLTKDADLHEFGFKGRVLASSIEHGSESYRGDMAVNVPIVQDKFAARVVVGYQDLGGWIDRPLLNCPDCNTATIKTGRLKLNAQPTDELSIGVLAWFSRDHRDNTSLSLDGRTRVSPINEPAATDYDIYGIKLGYDLGAFSVTSATSYIDWFVGDTFFSILRLPAIASTADRVFSEEVTFTSKLAGPWRWTAGSLYRDAEDRGTVTVPGFFATASDSKPQSKSIAVFGELTRVLGDGLELTGGLRYFRDRVTRDTLSVFTLPGNPPITPYSTEATFHATTPRVVLTWHPNSSVSTYTSYGEGFRSGISQDPALQALGFSDVDPDKLKNYELGAKGDLLGGRLSFDAALYYQKWNDVQQQLLVISPVSGLFVNAVLNGESASGPGVDFAVTWRPLQRLSLGVNLGWNELTADADVLTHNTVLIKKGERLDGSTETTTSVSAEYAFSMGSSGFNGRLFASANAISFQKATRYNAGNGTVSALRGDPLLFARAGFSITTPKGWEVTLFGDNLSNEEGIRTPYDPAHVDPYTARTQPRTIGVQFDYKSK